MNAKLIDARRLEFQELAEQYHNDALVHQIIEAYAHGQILTREECLMRIVVELAKRWDEEMERQRHDCIERDLLI